MRTTFVSRVRNFRVGVACACALLSVVIASPGRATAAEVRKPLLLLPIAGGTPGQEWSAKALGGILEEGWSSVRSVRLVTGAAREGALRELSVGAVVAPDAFREICRRAGADLAILGGSTLVAGRLALEVRTYDVGAGRELTPFHGEEPVARAFELAAAAIRHVAAEAALDGVDSLFPRGTTPSLEAYAAYRAALLEEAPEARIEKLRGVLKLDPAYADPTRRLGVELFRQGAVDEALGVLERAVTLGPKVAEARNNYGVALASAERPEPALREFEEAVSLAPEYAEARLNLARVYEDRGRPSDAEKQYAAILEADAGNDKARAGIAALYDRTGRPELAIKEFRLLSARRPELAEGEFIRLGQEARKAREYPRAEKFFLRAADVNPQFAQAWAELGTNSYLAGEFAKGVEYFRKALTIDPGQASFHYYLGLALDKGRQQEEALREYRRAVELGGPPEARLGLARAALESGDPGLAVEELNRLLVGSPDHAEAKVLLAQATTEMEARRRLVESQSQFANQRLARLEQIVADAGRANRELESRIQALTQEKLRLEKQAVDPVAAAEFRREADRLRAEKERLERELAAEREQGKRDSEALSQALDARAKHPEGGPGVAEAEELRQRLAVIQAAQARAQADLTQQREQRLQEVSRLNAELAAEREARRLEAGRSQAELAATEAMRGELAKKAGEAAELKGQLQAAQSAVAKADADHRAERERDERALLEERKERAAETEKLRADLAAGQLKRQEKERLLQEIAAEKARAAVAQAARDKAEKALAEDRLAHGAALEKLKGELTIAAGRAQDRDALARDRDKLAQDQDKLERERDRLTQELTAAREEGRRQSALSAARAAALETQSKQLEESLRARVAELDAARGREAASGTQLVKLQADLALLAERHAALEARLAAAVRTLGEREAALGERDAALAKARLAVRDGALELGRIALRTQSWEKARGYLEQATEVDPHSAEAWYGLGEVFFQLGQYEKSKQMYDKAKQIF